MNEQPSQRDRQLADLVAGLSDRLQRGEQIDLADVCQQHPHLQEDLRQLWGTVLVTQAVGRHSSHAADDPRTPAEQLDLPFQFGDYRVEEELGRGGMGVVYRAHKLSLGRDVAMKMILKGRLASDSDRKRFRAEAEAAARLSHPNIVSITDVGEHNGQAFFCMELIRDGTLADRLSSGPIAARPAARQLAAVARAIHFAHTQGVYHRDLKPSNILIGSSGLPYVADFGLAKRRQDLVGQTTSGAVLGTPSYMAPEQAALSRGEVGPTTDVYSLGAILYHMLTGRAPFQAASPVDTLLMVLEQDPLPPRMLNRDVDRDLEMIALRCLQKPQDLRYPSAEKLADDLEAFLNDESIAARDGRLGQIVAGWFKETHHASVLENWGLLWMWHSLVLLLACLATNLLYWMGDTNRWHYGLLWTVGFGTWAAVFWWLRRRMGPVTFVERQIAHVWFGSMVCIAALFPLEAHLDLPVLSLAPVIGLVAGMSFLIKAGILSGSFYIQSALLFGSAVVMALLPDFALSIFGLISAGCFLVPGWKYHQQRKSQRDGAARLERS